MKVRVKLFRWRDEQWKERGIGNAKLMRDREEKRIRFIMRQEKTLKPVANFLGKSQILSRAPAAMAEKLLTLSLFVTCSFGGTIVCSEANAQRREGFRVVRSRFR